MRAQNGINGVENTDITIILRAAATYYSALKNHIDGKSNLSEETIKYYIDRLLEITLTLEAVANSIYDSLSDEEKAVLKQIEQHRNRNLYRDKDGFMMPKKDIETIKTCIDTSIRHYDIIRSETKERLANND